MFRFNKWSTWCCCAAMLPGVGLLDLGFLLRALHGAEPAGAIVPIGANYQSSIPLQFLDASRSLTHADLIVPTARSVDVAPGRSFRGDVEAAEAAAMAGPGGHYFPTLPVGFESEPAGIHGASAPPSFAMQGPSPQQTPQQFSLPSSGTVSSTMPLDDASPFPLYVPGMPPQGYGVMPAQFEQPMPGPGFAGPPGQYGMPPAMQDSARAQRRAARGNPRWTVGIESLFLTEANSPGGPDLIQQVSNDAILLSAPQLAGSQGVGSRLTIARQHSERLGYEFAYSGLYGARQSASVYAANDLALAGPVALATLDYYQADNMNVNYDTTFHNFESNILVTPDTGIGTFLIGSRFIYWKERFDLQSTDSDEFTSNYVVNAMNRMYGAQVGWNGAVTTALGDTMLKLRGGVFGTHASQGQTLYDFDNTFDLRPATGAFDNRTSYLGECSIVQCLNPTEGVDLRIGYTMMWIDGLTRAPDQVDLSDNFDSGSFINSGGSVFMHGFSLGAAFSW